MHFTTVLTYLTLMSTTGWARYVLEDDYMKDGNFFDQFAFFEGPDPTNGFVAYQGRGAAGSLISGGAGNATFGVDSTNPAPNGRPSVRLTSNKSYQSGLFILDVEHMPGGICGTWPAFWMVGPDWPNQGEIDIIEGVNDQSSNDMTLHTGPGCTIGNGNSAYSGSLVSTNCVSGSGDNQGCQIASSDTATYGTNFNSNGGGVYATEWTSSAISIYWFPRRSIPSDIENGSPNPSSWGSPIAVFSGGCDMATSFTNQQIVFDTTFCGDWAGGVWDGSSCASSTGDTCENYVANNPKDFAEAYWTVNGLKVYQGSSGSGGSAPSGAPAPVPSSAPAPAPSSAGWGAGGQSSFHTVSTPQYSAPAPTSAPAPSAAPSWPAPSAAPAPTPSGSAIGQVSGQPGWPAPSAPQQGPPHHSWGGGSPWQSGGWGEYDNGNGAYVVGQPVQTGSSHARHLRKHKAHRAGRL